MATKKISLPVPGNTPLNKCSGLFGIDSLFVKDETKNPTHTFKDRLAYEAVRPIVETINSGQTVTKTTFASISYGNTAYSMAYYSALLNQEAEKKIASMVAFIPPSLKNKPFGPNTEGAVISPDVYLKKMFDSLSSIDFIEVDLTTQIYESDDLEKIARAHNLATGDFTDITEGLNRPAYVSIIIEAIERQLKFAPDYAIVPFGAGILCDEIIDYVADNELPTKVIPVSSGNPDTIAIMLYGPIWVNTKELLEKGAAMTRRKVPDKKGRTRDQYRVYHVSDDEILYAMKILHDERIGAEASGASGFALLPRLKEIDPCFNSNKHSVLVINTGNGLLNFL
jgi:threonine dehydratase